MLSANYDPDHAARQLWLSLLVCCGLLGLGGLRNASASPSSSAPAALMGRLPVQPKADEHETIPLTNEDKALVTKCATLNRTFEQQLDTYKYVTGTINDMVKMPDGTLAYLLCPMQGNQCT